MDTAISLRNVGKTYRLYESAKQRLNEALGGARAAADRNFTALRDVSLEIRRGETVGIIGRNGSGKSTLLQIIAGVLRPTVGQFSVRGRVSALLELGTGFNPEYTGRSNAFLNLALAGLSKREIEGKVGFVEEFAEIGEFIDQPLKHYSSGMVLRLGFACAVCVDPDILVVDEALSVGDVFFSQKCFSRIDEIIRAGSTCLFVSHDMQAILKVSQRAVFLERGEIAFDGAPEEAVSRYLASGGRRASFAASGGQVAVSGDATAMSAEAIEERDILKSARSRHGAGGLRVAALRVTDPQGCDSLRVRMFEKLYFHVVLRAEQRVADPSTGIHLFDRLGTLVFAAGTRQLRRRLPDLEPGQRIVVCIALAFNVTAGEYTFNVGASEPSEEGPDIGYVHDRHEMLGPIVVSYEENAVSPFYGVAQLPMEISWSFVEQDRDTPPN